MSILITAKATIILVIIILFIVKLLRVSSYQQHSGEYFSIKLLNWYSSIEISSSFTIGRRNTMTIANRLNTVWWVLTSLLLLLNIVGEIIG